MNEPAVKVVSSGSSRERGPNLVKLVCISCGAKQQVPQVSDPDAKIELPDTCRACGGELAVKPPF